MMQLVSNPWEVIDKIGNPFALAAFIVAIIGMYLRYKTLQKRKMLGEMSDENKLQAAEVILDKLHVDTSGLTKHQKYELAKTKLKDKSSHRRNLTLLAALIAIAIAILAYKANEKIDPPEPKYKVAFEINMIIPSVKDSIISRKVVESRAHRNNHCSSPRNINWEIKSDFQEGWKIIPDSIKIIHFTVRQNDRFNGVFDKTPRSFFIRGIVRNSGSCGVFGNDARGKLTVDYSYVEEKKSKTNGFDNLIMKGEVSKGEPIKFDLPKEVKDYSVILSSSSEEKILLSKNKKNNGEYILEETQGKILIKT